MTVKFWVKFEQNHEPELWIRDSFNEFWHELREKMLTYPLVLEWIIRNDI